jgi:hypothetical protein
MQKYTDEQIKNLYNNLPEDLKKVIFSAEIGESIKKIGEKYNLLIDKTGILGNETGMVMLGLTHPKDYLSNLAERLKIDKESAAKIGEDVNNMVFAKVRESLKKIHGVDGESVPSPNLPAAPSPTLPVSAPAPSPVPEIKPETKTEIKKYPSGDPYREPI